MPDRSTGAPGNTGLQQGFSFEEGVPDDAPLAARMRPRTLDEFSGQVDATGPKSMLRASVRAGRLPSVILWGPPGCGKTTLARILARSVEAEFVQVSAVTSGVADLRAVVGDAKKRRTLGRRTVLFVDEIHRFNKAQQDVILPHAEDGTVVLLGATTENPSFEVIAPLLSRARVVRLHALSDEAAGEIIDAALADGERGLGKWSLSMDTEARKALVDGAGGDARAALTALDIAATLARAEGATTIAPSHVSAAIADRRPYYDKAGDAHYDTISAFIKSLRGSDPDAALYWLARMIDSGEDPLFIVRRMVILAAEDVGLADPQALQLATACQQAVHFLGLPEGVLPMAECAVYLALAPKSNSSYAGYLRAKEAAAASSHMPVPLHLRNAVTSMMRDFGYGKGYRYAHDEPEHVAEGASYLPEGLATAKFYQPGALGIEAGLWQRLEAIRGRGASQSTTGNHEQA